MSFDVFISHASEDKDIARPLAQELAKRGLRVWLDEAQLHVGDSLSKEIEAGLAGAKFAVVVLSRDFFRKKWTQAELAALLARETGTQKLVLPVWHNVSAAEVAESAPLLADRLAVTTSQGLDTVARKIAQAVLLKAQSQTDTEAARFEHAVVSFERDRTASTNAREEHGFGRNERVFVVHGHDTAARESVCRFLERVGIEPIVLSDQPSGGQTIIEKFEQYASVTYAIALLTPDDAVVSAREPLFRARQNVILELGYFLAKLGRQRVCVLNRQGVEMPSDMYGIVWIELDAAQGWRISLARELKQAGLQVDLNRLL